MRLPVVSCVAVLLCCQAPGDPTAPSRAPNPPARPAIERIDPPARAGAMGPNLARDGDALLASWLEPAEPPVKGMRLRVARWHRGVWSAPSTIVQGENVLDNWADFPSVVAHRGTLVAHWAQVSDPDSYAYDVQLARSTDDGRTWSALGTPHRDGTATEHGFVSLVPDGDAVRAFWLDGRQMATGGHGHGEGAMTVRTALITDRIEADEPLDARVCDCCSTSAVVTAEGPALFYRDRTDQEIRDIATVRRTRSGWSKPSLVAPDAWRVPGCPVNGPSADAAGQRVAVGWFTYASERASVRLAFSRDGGVSFGAPIEVAGPSGREVPLGRVGVVWDGEDAVVSWLSSKREEASLLARRVAPDGRLGEPLRVAGTRAGRAAGFPRVVHLGQRIAFAWTEPGDASRVHVALVRRDALAAPRALARPTAEPPATSATPLGRVAPTFSTVDLEGQPVSLEALRGQPVLLNLWATWCEPCRRELPQLAKLHRRYAERGLVVVGLSVDQNRTSKQVRAFVTRRRLPQIFWHDARDTASIRFGAGALRHFLRGRPGRRDAFLGYPQPGRSDCGAVRPAGVPAHCRRIYRPESGPPGDAFRGRPTVCTVWLAICSG